MQEHNTALEGVKLQELQSAALQRKLEEGERKLRTQTQLHDAVKAERNKVRLTLNESQAEMHDMR